MSKIDQFKHRAIRDLAWALLRPGFFDQLNEAQNDWLLTPWLDSELIPWLYALDQQPEALFLHLKDQRATRLGIYFEQLLSFFFDHYPRFQLSAKNLQVYDTESKRTLGEYDFIVHYLQQKCHYHIEVAVKFYIGLAELKVDIAGNTPLNNWHHWVGPNLRDTMAIKMRHLLQHQLVISHTDNGRQVLPAPLNGINDNGRDDSQLGIRLLMTGRLYLPWHNDNTHLQQPLALPAQLSHQHDDIGYWLTLEQLQAPQTTFFNNSNTQYFVLPRQLWMSAIT